MGPTKWAQEYECFERTTKVTININNEIKTVTLEEMEQILCMLPVQKRHKQKNTNSTIFENTKGIQLLTNDGFQNFSGLQKLLNKEIYTLTLKNNQGTTKQIKLTKNHVVPVFDNNGEFLENKQVCKIEDGELLYGDDDTFYHIVEVAFLGVDVVYDVLDVGIDNLFFADGLLVHNCRFISSENLLIDPTVLEELNEGVTMPYYTSERHKIQFWDHFKRNRLYLVGVDPSAGTGSDYSVIQVFEFPSMTQVAMYRTNTMASPELYVVLKDLLNAIESIGAKAVFSIENNGVGEGIISLYQADEKRPHAEFVSESFRRLGFTTTNRSKLSACLLFKDMVENKSIHIKSPRTLSEMKGFIRKGVSYQAQRGSTDDCISAILIVLRILENMSSYDQIAYNKLFVDRPLKARQTISLTIGDTNDLNHQKPLT